MSQRLRLHYYAIRHFDIIAAMMALRVTGRRHAAADKMLLRDIRCRHVTPAVYVVASDTLLRAVDGCY